jgi:hypothetical protein
LEPTSATLAPTGTHKDTPFRAGRAPG